MEERRKMSMSFPYPHGYTIFKEKEMQMGEGGVDKGASG